MVDTERPAKSIEKAENDDLFGDERDVCDLGLDIPNKATKLNGIAFPPIHLLQSELPIWHSSSSECILISGGPRDSGFMSHRWLSRSSIETSVVRCVRASYLLYFSAFPRILVVQGPVGLACPAIRCYPEGCPLITAFLRGTGDFARHFPSSSHIAP